MAREITFTRLGGKVPFADGGLRLSKSILIDRIEPHGDFRSLFRIGDDLLERITNSIRENSFDASQPLHIWAKAEDDGIVHNYLIDGYTRRGTPGLIQSPIPSTTAIDTRCSQIQNFNSEKYYEFYGSFGKLHAAATCKGIYLSPENKTQFARDDLGSELKAGLQKEAKAIENKTEKKETPAPRLHNLNAVQKDAFRLYGLPAEETLSIIQKLYEEYKCVSYPPPPLKSHGKRQRRACERHFYRTCGNASQSQRCPENFGHFPGQQTLFQRRET